MLRGIQAIINGDGEQERDYVFVQDVARANLMALSDGDNDVFNLGWGIGTSVNTKPLSPSLEARGVNGNGSCSALYVIGGVKGHNRSPELHNWNVWMDLRIILKTIPALVRMPGAH